MVGIKEIHTLNVQLNHLAGRSESDMSLLIVPRARAKKYITLVSLHCFNASFLHLLVLRSHKELVLLTSAANSLGKITNCCSDVNLDKSWSH